MLKWESSREGGLGPPPPTIVLNSRNSLKNAVKLQLFWSSRGALADISAKNVSFFYGSPIVFLKSTFTSFQFNYIIAAS